MYAALTDLKTYLGVTSAEDDALLTDLLDRASAIIERATARRFAADVDATRRFDARRDVSSDGRLLFLGEDLCQVTSVINGDGRTVHASAFVTEPRLHTPYYGLRLKASSGLRWTYTDDPQDAIEITGRWAYSITPPDDIVHLCLRLAAYLYRQKDTQHDIGDLARAADDGVLLMPTRLPADVRDLLAPYRRLTP